VMFGGGEGGEEMAGLGDVSRRGSPGTTRSEVTPVFEVNSDWPTLLDNAGQDESNIKVVLRANLTSCTSIIDFLPASGEGGR